MACPFCIHAAGSLIYGGTLVLTNIGLSPSSARDSFKLFTAASDSGALTNLAPASHQGLDLLKLR